MDIGIFSNICACTFAIEIIVEIISIIMLKLRKNPKCWHLFFGVVIASIITSIVAMGPTNPIRDNAEGMSGVNVVIFSIAYFVFNVLLLLVGLIIKKTMKGINLEPTGSSAFISMITLLVNLFVLLGLPWIVNNMNSNIDNTYVINYLTNKYGSSNYEIVSTETRYDKTTKGVSEYAFEVKSGYMPDTFNVWVDKDYNHVVSDMFLPTYYSYKYGLKYGANSEEGYGFSELENYMEKIASEKYAVNVKDKLNAYGVYADYVRNTTDMGRIPAIEEVVGWYLKYQHMIE